MNDRLSNGKQRRWTRRKEARPEEITAAALELFVERGFANTRLEDVAARAGISKGTLYLYFANKEELFKAVVREALVARLVEFQGRIGKFQGSSFELLRLVFKTWWEKIGATPISGNSTASASPASSTAMAWFLKSRASATRRLWARRLASPASAASGLKVTR